MMVMIVVPAFCCVQGQRSERCYRSQRCSENKAWVHQEDSCFYSSSWLTGCLYKALIHNNNQIQISKPGQNILSSFSLLQQNINMCVFTTPMFGLRYLYLWTCLAMSSFISILTFKLRYVYFFFTKWFLKQYKSINFDIYDL